MMMTAISDYIIQDQMSISQKIWMMDCCANLSTSFYYYDITKDKGLDQRNKSVMA